ncbi:hypothetical protein NQ318_017880 [Aromia moschata]|uniref:Transcription factor IIIC 90kDa subunit N-terminal domain-containing protein n=1 Tax=Aromia moschata TaxID=1265417 RepID=A0AAV8YBZ4_9CUCU|nr:hypothetical protein NQ318_017880 [Aromia moschata]
MLAALSNLCNLEIYVRYVDQSEFVEYCLISNITEEIINMERKKWMNVDRFTAGAKLNELKSRALSVSVTAFTWSHLFKIGNLEVCVLLVGHMNGDITVWKINSHPINSKEPTKPHYLGKYSTHLKKITTMYWHQTTEFGGGLCFADLDGKMSILHVSQLNQEEANMDKELSFWGEADKVLVERITVMIYDNRTYILMVKRNHLIIYGISDSGNVFGQNIRNVGNLYIAGIYHFNNIILAMTMSGLIKEYTLSVSGERITLEEKTIPLKVDMSRQRIHGFFFSKNMVLFGLLAYPCQLSSFRKSKSFVNIFLFHNSLINPFQVLWHNESGSLRDYWDCFEALRLICLKDKRFPWLGLPHDLNYDDLSLLQLKTLRLLARLSEMVFNLVPVIRKYDIKPYIILHYLVQIKLIVNRMNKLFELRNSGENLSVFQMRSIDVQNFFLKEMVVKNILAKANVGKNFVSEIRHVMSIANELRYPPMIIGPLCLPPHADTRCSVSMMPILLVPVYKCPFCKVFAHEEIAKEEDVMMCPYCDVPMEKRDRNEIEECLKQAQKDYNLDSEEVKSVCFDDCLKEDISFSDVEENTSEYVIFSDSEDESNEKESKLRTLYLRMRDMSLEDIIQCDSECDEENNCLYSDF